MSDPGMSNSRTRLHQVYRVSWKRVDWAACRSEVFLTRKRAKKWMDEVATYRSRRWARNSPNEENPVEWVTMQVGSVVWRDLDGITYR
jgi:hypothetical protein